MKVVTNPQSTSKNISLPKFNSENSSVDPVVWCATVDMCWSERPLEGSAGIIALSETLQDKRENKLIILRGIENAIVNCTVQILSTVIINGHTLEILFHVVLDDYLKNDVMIGHEIFNQRFDVNITLDHFTISKS